MACLQESKLTEHSTFTDFPNFQTIRRDRPGERGGGGLLSLVHHSISYQEFSTDHLFPGDSIIEHQGFSISPDDHELKVINIYIPPTSCCPPGYTPNFDLLFSAYDEEDVLIIGDFNAHNSAWYSHTEDDQATSRGTRLAESLDNSNLNIINQDQPTRVPIRGPTSSSDLSITTAYLSINASWQAVCTLNSDHHPILFQLGDWFTSPPNDPLRNLTNLKKARWEDFRAETEIKFGREPAPVSCSTGEAS